MFRTVMYQLTAPNAICGRVIGRGGSKINSITVSNLIQYALNSQGGYCVGSFYIRQLARVNRSLNGEAGMVPW